MKSIKRNIIYTGVFVLLILGVSVHVATQQHNARADSSSNRNFITVNDETITTPSFVLAEKGNESSGELLDVQGTVSINDVIVHNQATVKQLLVGENLPSHAAALSIDGTMKIASLAGDGIARLCSENGVLTRGDSIEFCDAPTYPGTWQTSSAPSCSTSCGQSGAWKYGSVYCSGGTCDPNTKPSTPSNYCSATSSCEPEIIPELGIVILSDESDVGETFIGTYIFKKKNRNRILFRKHYNESITQSNLIKISFEPIPRDKGNFIYVYASSLDEDEGEGIFNESNKLGYLVSDTLYTTGEIQALTENAIYPEMKKTINGDDDIYYNIKFNYNNPENKKYLYLIWDNRNELVSCTNKPSNSHYTDNGMSSSNSCTWSCNSGYSERDSSWCQKIKSCTEGDTKTEREFRTGAICSFSYVCRNNAWHRGPQSCISFLAGTKITMADGTLKNIELLKKGDKVMSSSGETVVEKIHKYTTEEAVYSLNGSRYFVTGSHPFMTLGGWKSFHPENTRRKVPEIKVSQLKIGDTLLRENGESELLEKFDSINGTHEVYNLRVKGTHDFYADGYWVHNK